MSEIEKKPKKRQSKVPPLVETTETSGVDLIYPQSLILSDSIEDQEHKHDNLVVEPVNGENYATLVKTGPVVVPEIKNEPVKSTYKMDRLTQIYVGSLTVIGLFVFYRLLNRKR